MKNVLLELTLQTTNDSSYLSRCVRSEDSRTKGAAFGPQVRGFDVNVRCMHRPLMTRSQYLSMCRRL